MGYGDNRVEVISMARPCFLYLTLELYNYTSLKQTSFKSNL